MSPRRRARRGERARPGRAQWIVLGGSALAGLAGAIPGAGDVDPVALAAWLAWCAFPAGVPCGALGVRAWPWGLAVPGTWMIALALAGPTALEALPRPLWAAAAWTGLFAAGLGVGAALGERRAWSGTAAALAAATALVALPVRAGLPGDSAGARAPAVSARLFALAPTTFVLECGGADWMRHRAVYSRAGTDWFSDRRAPLPGVVAGPVALALGLVVAFSGARASRALARRGGALHDPSPSRG